MISNENIQSLAEAEKIINRLRTLDGFHEPDLYRVMIKELLPEYRSVTGDKKKSSILYQATGSLNITSKTNYAI